MTKLCSVCGTENREEAQFCRACGTALVAQAERGAASDGAAALNVCAECGFQNKPGLRYCANCGMSLAGAAGVADGAAAAAEGDPYAGLSPPPITYPSFATVGPYPPAPSAEAPDIPDPDAALALRQQEAQASGDAAMPFSNAPARKPSPVILGGVAVLLIVGGALAWTFMRSADPSPPAIGATPPPVAPTVRASSPPTPIIIEEAPRASPPPVAQGTSAVEPSVPPPVVAPPATTAGTRGTPPTAAASLPQVGDPAVESAEAEARRLAAERRREKAARDKAEREAKTKTPTEPRDQNAAGAQRAEQDAARRRAEEAQPRPRAPTAVPAPQAAAQPRGVREICAGRGTIAEAVCQSRQCGSPEHANEQICRQLRELDERRRNYQN